LDVKQIGNNVIIFCVGQFLIDIGHVCLYSHQVLSTPMEG
jgi:hypothetical protein